MDATMRRLLATIACALSLIVVVSVGAQQSIGVLVYDGCIEMGSTYLVAQPFTLNVNSTITSIQTTVSVPRSDSRTGYWYIRTSPTSSNIASGSFAGNMASAGVYTSTTSVSLSAGTYYVVFSSNVVLPICLGRASYGTVYYNGKAGSFGTFSGQASYLINYVVASSPTPSPSPSPTVTPTFTTFTPSPSPTITPTFTPSPSPTITPTFTPSPTPVEWCRHFDFRIDDYGFTPIDGSAVYTAGSGWSPGNPTYPDSMFIELNLGEDVLFETISTLVTGGFYNGGAYYFWWEDPFYPGEPSQKISAPQTSIQADAYNIWGDHSTRVQIGVDSKEGDIVAFNGYIHAFTMRGYGQPPSPSLGVDCATIPTPTPTATAVNATPSPTATIDPEFGGTWCYDWNFANIPLSDSPAAGYANSDYGQFVGQGFQSEAGVLSYNYLHPESVRVGKMVMSIRLATAVGFYQWRQLIGSANLMGLQVSVDDYFWFNQAYVFDDEESVNWDSWFGVTIEDIDVAQDRNLLSFLFITDANSTITIESLRLYGSATYPNDPNPFGADCDEASPIVTWTPSPTLDPSVTPTLTPTATATVRNATPTLTPTPLVTRITPTPTIYATWTPRPTLNPTEIVEWREGRDDENYWYEGINWWGSLGSLFNGARWIVGAAVDALGKAGEYSSMVTVTWNTTQPSPIPNTPRCETDAQASQLCAVFYLLEHTLFSPPLGSAILLVLLGAVDVAIILRIYGYIKTAIELFKSVTGS